MTGALAARIDLLDPAVLDDPYPEYARLRAAGPVARAGPGSWLVLRYADVSALLTDPRLGSGREEESSLFGAGPAGTLAQRIMAGREGADHTALRRILAAAIRAGRQEGRREVIARAVDTLLAPGLDGEVLDVVADLAFPLQALVVCDLLGLPAAERHRIWPTAAELGRTFIPYRLPDPETTARADRAVDQLRGIIGGWFDDARRHRVPGLVGDLAAALGGPDGLTRDDLVDNLVFLLFAGFEPTMNMTANGFSALLAHPGERDRLLADPTLAGTAVGEFLRYDAPTQYTMRVVREPVEIGGRSLRPGRMLLLGLGSANRDGDRFPGPDRLDLGRHPNPHLSFGGGTHHCSGWSVARSEGEAVFHRIATRVRALEPAGPAIRLRHPNFRAHESLPVRLRAA